MTRLIYKTKGGTPSSGETFQQFIEHMRLATEAAAMLGHLEKANGQEVRGIGWLSIAELLNRMVDSATKLATEKLY